MSSSAPSGSGRDNASKPVNTVFVPTKRKAGAARAHAAIDHKQQAIETALRELRTWTHDANSAPRRRDYPAGDLVKKGIVKHLCVILASSTVSEQPVVNILQGGGLGTALRLDSQCPALVIRKGSWEVVIYGDNFLRHPREKPDEDPIFRTSILGAKALTLEKVKKAVHYHGHNHMPSDADMNAMAGFGTITQDLGRSGLDLFSFSVVNPVTARWTKHGDVPKLDTAIETLLHQMKTSQTLISIIRQSIAVQEQVDVYWRHRVRSTAIHGLYLFYTDVVDQAVSDRFKKWIEDPNTKMPHQPWMETLAEDRKTDAGRIFASHTAKFNFASMAEWQIIMSVSHLHEVECENQHNAKYFGQGIQHQARVLRTKGNVFSLEILIPLLDGVAPPVCGEGTIFALKGISICGDHDGLSNGRVNDNNFKSPGNVNHATNTHLETMVDSGSSDANDNSLGSLYYFEEELELDEEEGRERRHEIFLQTLPEALVGTTALVSDATVKDMATVDASSHTDIPLEQITHEIERIDKGAREDDARVSHHTEKDMLHKQRRARATGRTTRKTVIVSFCVREKEIEVSRKVFEFGRSIMVELQIHRNSLPSQRMLKAISDIANAPTKGYTARLQSCILGERPLPFPKGKAPIDAINPKIKPTVENLIKGIDLNKSQTAAFDSAVRSADPMSLIQGPPGTGMAKTVTAIALGFSMVGMRTVLCAPTREACSALMTTMVPLMESLYERVPVCRDLKKVLYLPNARALKDQFTMPLYDALEAADDDDTECSGKFKEYELWTQVIEWIKARATGDEIPSAERLKASRWCKTRLLLNSGIPLKIKDYEDFNKVTELACKSIISDQKYTIIVCTSRTAALAKEYGLRAHALIVDGADSVAEGETVVALALRAAKNVITARGHQHLRRIVYDPVGGEYAAQVGISFFERLSKAGNVPLFRLDINADVIAKLLRSDGNETDTHTNRKGGDSGKKVKTGHEDEAVVH